MAFCTSCGHELSEGARFCSNCGTSQINGNNKERQQEWAGKVIKCPACGAELPSFTAICSSCGHEINSQAVSPSLSKLISDLDEIERAISIDPVPVAKGWKTWSNKKRIAWLIFNLATFFIPVAVKYAFPIIKRMYVKKDVKGLTALERRKVAIIENHVFPNEREALVEGMLFIKAKIEFLAAEKSNEKTVYWMRLWHEKAKQIRSKADIMLPNDTAIMEAYKKISEQEEKSNKRIKRQGRIAGALLLILCIVCFLVHPLFEEMRYDVESAVFLIGYGLKESHAAKHFSEEYSWPSEGLGTLVPVPETEIGKIEENTAKKFVITVYGVSTDEFAAYKNACKESGFTSVSTENDAYFRAFNPEEYEVTVKYTESYSNMAISVFAPIETETIHWPQTGIASYLPTPSSLLGVVSWEREDSYSVTISNTTKVEYKEYVQCCMKAGFTVDYTIDDNYFWADNNAGDHVSISWEIPNRMEISISGEYVEPQESLTSHAPENAADSGEIAGSVTKEDPKPESEPEKNYEWPKSGLATYLPETDILEAKITRDNETRFSIEFYNVTQQQFEEFANACKDNGFTINITKTDSVFYAYNQEKYDLDIIYMIHSDKSMNVYLDAPMKMSEIRWPDSKLVGYLPVPETLIGNISSESSERFAVYIDNTSVDAFSDYIDRCLEAGFSRDYSRSESRFEGYNWRGYRVCVEHHVFDVMYISIKAPEK